MTLTVLELNPQATSQYGFPRRNGATPSGTIGLHTAENRPDLDGLDTGAEQVAQHILTRQDHGSYHTICDADSRLRMAPFSAETWGITTLNNWAIHIAGATTAASWSAMPAPRRESIVTNMALAAAEAARWCFDEHGVVVPAVRLTRAEAEARRPGFVAHADADPGRRSDPGPDFPWDLFLAVYREAVRDHQDDVGVERAEVGAGRPTVGQPSTGRPSASRAGAGPSEAGASASARGGTPPRPRTFLPLTVDGDYGHRTITEHQRALAACGHYKGVIEEDQGRPAVAGPVLWTAYQRFLAALGFYSGRIDGDFGKISVHAEQRFLAAARMYGGAIDGSRGPVTVRALQGTLNQRRMVVGRAAVTAVTMPPMINPAVGRITSEYGPRRLMGNTFHAGIDIANATGTDVWAAFDGTVVETGTNIEPGRSGKGIRIRCDDGETTYYGHLSAILVRPGQRVQRGQHIGEMGATGNVTGPHLHFEIWRSASGTTHRDPRIDFRHFGVTPGVDNRPRGSAG